MGEWLKPAVLKTVSGVTRSGVRIPLPPPNSSAPPPRRGKLPWWTQAAEAPETSRFTKPSDTNVLVAALRSKRGASHQLVRLIGQSDWRLNISVALAFAKRRRN